MGYALGSVLNHVLLHQTIIGHEAKKQLELAGDYPDILIARHGGGSNFGWLVFPFLSDKLAGTRKALRAIAVEPSACPSLTAGTREYDFGDTAGSTPLMMMHTLGHTFMPAPVHAGGLRHHGSAPLERASNIVAEARQALSRALLGDDPRRAPVAAHVRGSLDAWRRTDAPDETRYGGARGGRPSARQFLR
jgi:predicted alternative tryptophan synthase beta-subunit